MILNERMFVSFAGKCFSGVIIKVVKWVENREFKNVYFQSFYTEIQLFSFLKRVKHY